MSYMLHTDGVVIAPIASTVRKPSVTQCRLMMSAPSASMDEAFIEPKRAGDRQMTTGERCRRLS